MTVTAHVTRYATGYVTRYATGYVPETCVIPTDPTRPEPNRPYCFYVAEFASCRPVSDARASRDGMMSLRAGFGGQP